jgi:hypothetical protein|tara:strand:- start:669 stop:833 length:165 start_codon:yes stop_codon:yes gene_type:complete
MNYPDNIGCDTSDPRSPFYTEPPECDECGEELSIDVDCDEDGPYTVTHCKNCDD